MANPRRIPRAEDFNLEVEVEAASSQLTELVWQAMDEDGVSRAELARRLGVAPPQVTQLLRGQRNWTLRTIVEALYVLDRRLDIAAKRRSDMGDQDAGSALVFEAKTTESPSTPDQVLQYLANVRAQTQRAGAPASSLRWISSSGASDQPQFRDIELWLHDRNSERIGRYQHPTAPWRRQADDELERAAEDTDSDWREPAVATGERERMLVA
jgi:transcriptional regulator with XRE-family HTH domain